uniref:Uncharacterized protein n=1 Tax=Anguilla anguilla TaxID=7936 RepID=A0A0E9PCN3_ANGAN
MYYLLLCIKNKVALPG